MAMKAKRAENKIGQGNLVDHNADLTHLKGCWGGRGIGEELLWTVRHV